MYVGLHVKYHVVIVVCLLLLLLLSDFNKKREYSSQIFEKILKYQTS